jgi:hypothetical protein
MVKPTLDKSLDIGHAFGLTNVEYNVSLELHQVIFHPLLIPKK